MKQVKKRNGQIVDFEVSKITHAMRNAFESEHVAVTQEKLEEMTDADLLIHVIDASDPDRDQQVATVDALLVELGLAEKPRLVVWNKADEFRGQSKVSTWIFGIAYKKALKRLKSNKRLAGREIHCEVDIDDGSDFTELLGQRVLIAKIRAAVAELPLVQRSIVHLAFFYGYTYPEIAEIVGCPVNTVKTRMFYARERLRPILELAMTQERHDARR